MTTTNEPLPEFENPPVVEVVCGITFKPIEQLTVPRIGQLWGEYRNDYPQCSEKPQLPPTTESYEEKHEEKPIEISFDALRPRSWFISEDERTLIQIQKDRFLHNWKKIDDSDEYPRYGRVIEMFRTRFRQFEEFLAKESLGELHHLQYEMTYVNHIPFEGSIESLGDIGSLFPDLSWRTDQGRFLQEPENIGWKVSFLLPQKRGRLRVGMTIGTRISDQASVLRLDLTVRGIPPENPSNESMYTWFGEAREWIVRGFDDLTSEKAKKELWEKTS